MKIRMPKKKATFVFLGSAKRPNIVEVIPPISLSERRWSHCGSYMKVRICVQNEEKYWVGQLREILCKKNDSKLNTRKISQLVCDETVARLRTRVNAASNAPSSQDMRCRGIWGNENKMNWRGCFLVGLWSTTSDGQRPLNIARKWEPCISPRGVNFVDGFGKEGQKDHKSARKPAMGQ